MFGDRYGAATKDNRFAPAFAAAVTPGANLLSFVAAPYLSIAIDLQPWRSRRVLLK